MALSATSPRLSYGTHGSGPPLVFVNGLGGVQAAWLMAVRDLSRNFTVVTYDHRGVGGSEIVDRDVTMEDYARDLVQLLDFLSIPRASFVGLSFGGRVLQALALGWPERVDRLVLGGTSAGGRLHVVGDTRAQAGLRNAAALDEKGWLETVIPSMFGATFRANNPDRIGNLARWWARHPPNPIGVSRQWQAYERFDVSDRLGEIRAPVLILHGSDDGLSPPQNALNLLGGLPDGRLQWLSGVGHSPNVEAPGVFHTAIRQFLLPPPTTTVVPRIEKIEVEGLP